jgi:hypothetical protein
MPAISDSGSTLEQNCAGHFDDQQGCARGRLVGCLPARAQHLVQAASLSPWGREAGDQGRQHSGRSKA